MKAFALTAAAALGLILSLGGDARAQYYRPGYPGGGYGGYGGRPTVSPYLNLLGRGNPAINYYGIVRPQLAMENALFGPAGGGGAFAPGDEMSDPELRRATGHAVAFNNLSHFYHNNPATGGGQGGGMGGAARYNTLGGAGAAGGAGAGRGGAIGGARGGISTPGISGGFGPTIR